MKPNMQGKEYLFYFRTLLPVIVSITIGFFLEYASHFDIKAYENIRQQISGYRECLLDSAEYVNCQKTGNQLLTKNGDPQIIFHNIDAFAGYVEIQLEHPQEHAWELQLYYSSPGNGFCEERSVSLWVSKYEDRIFAKIGKNLSDLRIDLGMEPNVLFTIKKININPSRSSYLLMLLQKFSFVRFLIDTVGIYLLLLCLTDWQKALDIFYRKRWILGGIIIAICTVFQIHGSSFGCLQQYHGLPGYDYGKLFGQYRLIRSDEYAVFTPMALSQVSEGFPWFSEKFRYSMTDMVMVYGQPVKSLLMLFRPFQIGYLLFGAQRGLAFYWVCRFVICFLVSFEFGRMLTKDDKGYAVAYAFLVALSPQLQWWFSIGALAEMLIFGQSAVLLFNAYLHTSQTYQPISFRKNFFCVVGMILCAGGYALSMYPAWQISLFYIFLVCAVSVFIEKRKLVRITRNDLFMWFGGILIVVSCMIPICIKSRAAIQAEMHTVYPGARDIAGGSLDKLPELFRGWSSILWSFADRENPCEVVGFFDFFPWGILLSVGLLCRQKKRDIWLVLLNVVNLLCLSFLCFPWPQKLAELTLLNQVPPERLETAVGLLNLMLLFRALPFVTMKKKRMVYIAAATSAITTVAAAVSVDASINISLKTFIIGLVFAAAVIFVQICGNGKKWLIVYSMVLSVIGGGLVNPVCYGLEGFYDSPVIRNIAAINHEEEGMWAVELGNSIYNNLPAAIGIKTLNTVHTYPDADMWKALGLETEDDIWNRYAHINLNITKERNFKSRLELLHQDQVLLYLNIQSLRDLGVRYLLTRQDFSQSDELKCLYQYRSYFIYDLGKT